ncbi:pilus assembly PilX family protein [Rossellomorea marisflavi]|uniref:pilus assembly PilX family protein n=1 Tax=Rossellomorea marisflavi TaxID=189381 RepID=UPI0034577A60
MLKKHLTNERGMSLMMVFLLMIVLTVLGMGIMSVVISNTRATSSERDNQAAYYIAEAGMTKQLKAVDDIVKDAYENKSNKITFYEAIETNMPKGPIPLDLKFAESFGVEPSVVVTISPPISNTYTITSTGTIGKRSKKIETTFTVNWKPKGSQGGISLNKDLAVYTANTFTMDNGTINGNIGSNSDQMPSITFPGGGPTLNGGIYVPKGYEDKAVKAASYLKMPKPIALKEVSNFQLPPFPVFPNYPTYPDLTINKGGAVYKLVKDGMLKTDNEISNHYTMKLPTDAYFKEIRLTASRTINLDIGDTNRSIVVDHLNLQNGHLNIIGNGKLTIYVKDQITMLSGSTINYPGKIEQLNLYLATSSSSSPLRLAGAQKISGSLYAESADIEMTGGGGFQGHILTGGNTVTLTGGSRTNSSLLYAPNATIKMLEGGIFTGMIVSKNFQITGGGRVNYQLINTEDIPFILGGSTDEPVELISLDPVRETDPKDPTD